MRYLIRALILIGAAISVNCNLSCEGTFFQSVSDDATEALQNCSSTNIVDENRSDIIDADGITRSDVMKNLLDDSCTLYVAPSSIPNSGLGVYTTRDILNGQVVNRFQDSPSIVIVDQIEPILYVHRNYVWEGHLFTAYEADHIQVNCPSWSSLCNHHMYLNNIIHDSGIYDDTLVDRYKDPSAGSFSYHSGINYIASRNIQAGEELFVNYGEAWLNFREGTYADWIPRSDDFALGSKIIQKLFQYRATGENFDDMNLSRMIDLVSVMNPRVASMLPRTKKGLESLENVLYPTDLEPNAAKLAFSPLLLHQHNISWIRQHGVCMENVKANISTIPFAGRGAFATRPLPKDSIITLSPLVHVMNKDDLLMYDKNNTNYAVSSQLLLNYCFGHRDSQILLCPQSSQVLMNHCSVRIASTGQCDSTKGPNAMFKWSSTQSFSSLEEVNITLSFKELEKLYYEGSIGLTFQVVATRDILPDEEIFLDYGAGWEAAWSAHVRAWQPPSRNNINKYSPIALFLSEHHEILTIDELNDNPYPENIVQTCVYDPVTADEYGMVSNDAKYDLIIENGRIFSPIQPLIDEDYLYQCVLLEKSGNSTYTILIVPSLDNEKHVLVKNYPGQSVTFRMKPYSSDQHLRNSFRHYIEIPDEIFPIQWKITKSRSKK